MNKPKTKKKPTSVSSFTFFMLYWNEPNYFMCISTVIYKKGVHIFIKYGDLLLYLTSIANQLCRVQSSVLTITFMHIKTCK